MACERFCKNLTGLVSDEYLRGALSEVSAVF